MNSIDDLKGPYGKIKPCFCVCLLLIQYLIIICKIKVNIQEILIKKLFIVILDSFILINILYITFVILR